MPSRSVGPFLWSTWLFVFSIALQVLGLQNTALGIVLLVFSFACGLGGVYFWVTPDRIISLPRLAAPRVPPLRIPRLSRPPVSLMLLLVIGETSILAAAYLTKVFEPIYVTCFMCGVMMAQGAISLDDYFRYRDHK